jgi:hypothetical protein
MQQTNQQVTNLILKRRTSISKRPITRGNGFRVAEQLDAFTKRGAQLAAARKDDLAKGTSGIMTANGVIRPGVATDMLKVLGHIIEHGDDVAFWDNVKRLAVQVAATDGRVQGPTR